MIDDGHEVRVERGHQARVRLCASDHLQVVLRLSERRIGGSRLPPTSPGCPRRDQRGDRAGDDRRRPEDARV